MGEEVEKREPLHTVGENVTWGCRTSLQGLNTVLPCDLEVPSLGVSSRGIKTYMQAKNSHVNVDSSAIHNTLHLRQCKRPPADERINRMRSPGAVRWYFSHKKQQSSHTRHNMGEP